MSILIDLKNAINHTDTVVITCEDGNTIIGYPTWGTNQKRVQIRTTEGIIWIPLKEIEHVTRVIPFNK